MPGGTYTYFDAIQLEEGGISAYAPQYPFEVGPTLSEPSQVIWTNEAPTVKLRAFNNGTGSSTKQLAWTLYDWTNAIVWSGTTNLTATASNFTSANLSVPVTAKGHFRFTTSITNQNSDDELTWTVINPTAQGLDTNSYFGTHINNSSNAMLRAARLGAHYRRAFSGGRLRWSEVEISDNVFVWPAFTNDPVFGLTIMATLGEDTPSWIVPATSNTNYFWRFCSNAVVQYTNSISRYEIWNEPDQDTSEVPNMAHYAQLLKDASLALKSVDPRVQVIGGGGVQTYTIVTNIWALLGTTTNRVDVMSVHQYPGAEGNAAAFYTSWTATPIWNTETGIGDKGSYTFSKFPYRTAGHYVIAWKAADPFYDTTLGNADAMSKNLLTCLAYGQKREFFYDGIQRNIEVADFDSRQFTMLDYDDSIRIKGAIYANLFYLLDKCTGFGALSFSNQSCFAFFSQFSTPMVAVWAQSNMTAVLSTDVNASDLRVYDLMGNMGTLPTRTLNFGRLPLIVENIGSVTFEQMCKGFSNAVVTARPDVLAPKLVQSAWPAVHKGIDHFRWFAVDDSGVPDESDGNRLQYRTSVNGGAFSAWGQETTLDYIGASLPTVIVQSRDASGNISTVGGITNAAKITGKMKIIGRGKLQ